MTLRALLVLLTALAFAISPFLLEDFGGYDPDQFPIPFADPPASPAGYAFAIWSVIYIWLAVMAGFGLWKRVGDPAWDGTRSPLIASFGIGAIWLPVAQVSPIWATVLIWAMLVPALMALLRTPARDVWWLRVPIGLYAGWLTAASCVSVALVLTGYGLPPLGPFGWAIAAQVAALAIAVPMLRVVAAPSYGIALVWALVAIAVRNGTDLPGLAAMGAAALALLLTLRVFGRARRGPA